MPRVYHKIPKCYTLLKSRQEILPTDVVGWNNSTGEFKYKLGEHRWYRMWIGKKYEWWRHGNVYRYCNTPKGNRVIN